MLKLLSLRETSLINDALYNFMGSSLESIDVSETMVMDFHSFLICHFT